MSEGETECIKVDFGEGFSQTNTLKRNVSFSNISIHEFDLALGDNPSVGK